MDDAHTTEIVTVEGGLRTDPGLPAGALAALETSLQSTNGSGRGPRSIARRLGPLTSVLVLAVVAAAGFLGGVKVQKHQGGTTTRVAAGATGGGAAARAAGGPAGVGGAAAASTTPGAAGSGAGAGGVGAAGGQGAGAGGGGQGAGRRAAAGAADPAASGGAGTGAAGTGAAAGGGAGARAGFAGAATAGQVKLVDGPNIYVTDAQGNVVKVVTSDASRFTRTGQGSIADVRPGDTVVVQGQKGTDGIVTASAVADTGAAAAG